MGRLKQPAPRLRPLQAGRLARSPDGTVKPERRWNPLRHLYATKRWRETKRTVFARDLYTCSMCRRVGQWRDLVCDHVKPHQGDERLFWPEANLTTLCKSPCHDQHKQRLEQAARHHAGVWD